MSKLTKEEYEILTLIGESVDKFMALPVEHPSEQQEFVHHIHIIQRMIMCRPTRRDFKK